MTARTDSGLVQVYSFLGLAVVRRKTLSGLYNVSQCELTTAGASIAVGLSNVVAKEGREMVKAHAEEESSVYSGWSDAVLL